MSVISSHNWCLYIRTTVVTWCQARPSSLHKLTKMGAAVTLLSTEVKMPSHVAGGMGCRGTAGCRPRRWGSRAAQHPSLSLAGLASPGPGRGFHLWLAQMGGMRIPLIEILPRKLVYLAPNPHPLQELPNIRLGQRQLGASPSPMTENKQSAKMTS